MGWRTTTGGSPSTACSTGVSSRASSRRRNLRASPRSRSPTNNASPSLTGRSMCAIFTARKRCLGQGNVFTRVCHSVHIPSGGGRGGLCVVSRPVWLLGPMFLQGDLCLSSYVPSRVSNSRPMFHPGGLPDKDPLDKNPPGQRPPWTETPGQKPTRQRPLCTVKSGQYASYWNAFLFSL